MRITGGQFKNRTLKAPKVETTRPTSSKVRQAVFNLCQHYLEDADVLDVFAGSGAIGLEALSRGAAHATFIEKNRVALGALKSNIETLGVADQTTVYASDAERKVRQLKTRYDLVFLDPPYGLVLDHLDHLLKPDGLLIYESSRKIELRNLKLVKEKSYGGSSLYLFEKDYSQ